VFSGPPPEPTANPAVATLTTFTRFARLDACERWVARLEAEAARDAADRAQSARDFALEQARRTRARADQICASVGERRDHCAKQPKHEQVPCNSVTEVLAGECKRMQDEANHYAERAVNPPAPAPHTPPSCRAEDALR
jgi:hypothetical protein